MMTWKVTLVVLLLLNVCISLAKMSARCPGFYANRETKPLYVLTLLSLPGGLSDLSGHRIAQEEINNHTDLLPGYHIELIVDAIEDCSSPEAGLVMSNLLKYTVNPPCHPIVAVAGLGCSSHTAVLSPVAGHDGFDLIQLSSANSLIFETQSHRFPHLWRFVGSASAYTDAILAIMDQYNWTRIGIVYNTGLAFHSDAAKHLEQKVKSITTKSVTFCYGMRGSNRLHLNGVISNILETTSKILISLLDEDQAVALLNLTLKYELVYPKYIWIHIENFRNSKSTNSLFNATHGHISLHTQTHPEQNQTVLESGETLAAFEKRLSLDLILLQEEYTTDSWPTASSLRPGSLVNHNWYDQIWALALALNKSLPLMKSQNLSIDNYTIGQDKITTVIEDQLANLSFQGAGGWIQFNQHRSTTSQRTVHSLVEIMWILDNGRQQHVGLYNPLDPSNFHVRINASSLPNDNYVYEIRFIHIPLSAAVILYGLTVSILILTTVQLFFYLHYRRYQPIKATSPHLSMLIFTGCYIFCLAALAEITKDSFKVSQQSYTTLVIILIVLYINAINLTLIPLLVVLLRVVRIFSSKLKSDLGKCWNNVSLLTITISVTVVLNVLVIPVTILEIPISFSNYSLKTNDHIIPVHIRAKARADFNGFGLVIAYLLIFLLIISCLAIRTRKIRYKNFKDTKKINLLIALLIVITCLSTTVHIMLHYVRSEWVGDIILILNTLSFPLLLQLVLFTTKIIPVVLEKLHINVFRQNHWHYSLSTTAFLCTCNR